MKNMSCKEVAFSTPCENADTFDLAPNETTKGSIVLQYQLIVDHFLLQLQLCQVMCQRQLLQMAEPL